MNKKKNPPIKQETAIVVDEAALFERVSAIIENRKAHAENHVNIELNLMYWEIGNFINSVVLNRGRGSYGKQILSTVSTKLVVKYGKSFAERNMYRMAQFAELFSDSEIVQTLSVQLTWSHIVELLPLKTQEARLYYAKDVAERKYGVRELRHQISRKAYERREIANTELSEQSTVPFNAFKDRTCWIFCN